MDDATNADRISWQDYFMAIGFLSAQRSKDPITQVGACIVRNNIVVGTGYNGMPNGDDTLPWDKQNKASYVCHAEMNAIMNTYLLDFKDCIIYVTLFPCDECAKLIIKSGIKIIVYNSDEKREERKTKKSKKLLSSADIECRQYLPSYQNIKYFSKNSFPKSQTDFNDKSDEQKRPNLKKQKTSDEEMIKYTIATINEKRTNHLSWDDYLMGMAFLSSKKSDSVFREGACIINLEKRIVGIGFSKTLIFGEMNEKEEIHAEMDAIMNKTIVNLKHCTMYVTSSPCSKCMKLIIQSGIKEIVYNTGNMVCSDLYSNLITYRKYELTGETEIKFTCSSSRDVPTLITT